MIQIKVQQEDFNLSDVYECFALANHDKTTEASIGAVVTFTGLVRDFQTLADDETKVIALTLEHYPGMTENSLKQIAQHANERWSLANILIVHRVGTLAPGDNIVLVATASAHRKDAFEACEYIMDYLKTSAPFWKKEETTAGSRWVESRSSDQQAIQKWITPSDLQDD